MSDLIVEVIKIDEVKPHPHADRLDIAVIGGWDVVIQKNTLQKDNLAVYFPLDSIIPEKLSNYMGITTYLKKGRVKAANLRGVASYGTLLPLEKAEKYICNEFELGEDVAEIFGITKYKEPMNCNAQAAKTPNILFEKYTDINNYRNQKFKDMFSKGEEIVITEKIHGCNARYSYLDGKFIVGSHNVELKYNDRCKWNYILDNNIDIKRLLIDLSDMGQKTVILYCEIFGHGIQDLQYGMINNTISFKVFDIKVDGKYLDYDDFKVECDKHNLNIVPVLYRGKFSDDIIKGFSECKSTVENATNIMEGIVFKPIKERKFDQHRTVLKYVFDQYLLRKKGTEFK